MNLERKEWNRIADRFSHFFDGVVREIRLTFSSEGRISCEIHIEAKDQEAPSGWSIVEFSLSDVAEFRFERGKRGFEVLSDGIQVAWRDSRVIVVLDAYQDCYEEIPELDTNIAYVIGASCDWVVTQLQSLDRE